MEKVRKCFLVSYFGLSNAGGLERVCYYMSHIIQRKGFQVVVVDKKLIENWKAASVYMRLTSRVHALIFPLWASLYICLHKRKGDISITNGFHAPFFRSDYLVIHGTLIGANQAINTGKPSLKQKIMFFFEKTGIRNALRLIAVSNNTMAEANRYYLRKSKPYDVINNAVDSSVFYPVRSVDSGCVTVVFCGRLDYGKGLHHLLELANEIEHTHGYCLKIATNNSDNVELFMHLKKTSMQVGLTIDTLNCFYNSGNVMFFPSMYEGFEMVTLEALSAGIPVLGNDVGAIAELVQRKEPGVALIDAGRVLEQLGELARHYFLYERRQELHDYYREHYGLEIYKQRLEHVLGI